MTRIIREEVENGNDVLVVAVDETIACEAAQAYLDSKEDAKNYEYEVKNAWELDDEELTEEELNEDMKAYRCPYNVYDR